MNVGKIIDEPSDKYHASGAIGSTMLNCFHESPLLFYQRFVTKVEPLEITRAVEIGQLVHTCVLEPSKFDSRFELLPEDHDGRNLKGRERMFAIKNSGKIAIAHDDWQTFKHMLAGLQYKHTAMELLEHTEREVTWRLAYGKFAVQARTDIWNEKGARLSYNGEETGIYFADIKKIRSHDYPGFQKAIYEYGYHRQTVLYQEVIAGVLGLAVDAPRPRCFHIVIEETAPYETEIREIDSDTLDIARSEIFQDLKELKWCFENNVWPGKSDKVVPIGLQYWAKKQSEERLASGSRLNLMT